MQPRTYADEVTRILRELLPEALRGAWLVGSLAWDDYHAGSSDIDIMAVADLVQPELRLTVARELAAVDCPARGLEFVLYGPPEDDQPAHWQLNLNTSPPSVSVDPSTEPPHWFVLDVAMARERAVPLFGPPARELLAPVPPERIHRALELSLDWHAEFDVGRPNAVLNACRAWRYAETGRWSSKTTAALWARERLADPALVDDALATRGN